MKIVNGFIKGAVLLTIAMNTALADYSVTQIDCATGDYEKQVKRYSEQMAAAETAGQQDLYAQARDALKTAQDNVAACDALKNQQSAAQ